MAFSVNSKGRALVRGKFIEDSLRGSILDSIIADGGDPASGYFPGSYSDVAHRFRVSSLSNNELNEVSREKGM